MEPLVLTFDIGTQSTRAMLVNKNGDIVAIKQKKYKEQYFSKENGWAEQKSNFYYDEMIECAVYLSETEKEKMKDVKAVTITCIRDTMLCLDKDNKPLRDIIVWLDKREADLSKLPKVSALKKLLFKLVGVTDMCNMQRKQSVCNWIMTNEKEIWDNTAKYVGLPTYLNYLMTGKLIDSVSNQIGHIPIDYKNGVWMKKGLTRFLFDVPCEKLVDLCKPGDVIGEVKKELSDMFGIPEGTPLIATGSDKGCETLGLSVFTKDKAAISFGTTATCQFMTKDYFEPTPFAPSYPAVIDGYYNPEIQIYRGFWMISWFKKFFGKEEHEIAKERGCSTEDVLNEGLKDVPPGSEGLILQPFWGAGVANPAAKGAIIGFNDVHGKKHIYRSIIEGINYALLEGMENMEKRGKQEIKEIYLGGGGSQSDEICQITADIFGLPTKRIQTHEACGLGSSMVAFVSIGEFKSIEEASKSMVHDKNVFIPNIENHKIYEGYYKIYKKMYSRLEPLYYEYKR